MKNLTLKIRSSGRVRWKRKAYALKGSAQVQGKRRSCSGRGRFAGRGKGGMVQWNKHGAVKGAKQDAGDSRDCGQC